MRNNTYLKEMGARISAIRISKRLFKSELARLCNLKRGTVSEIEAGKKDCHILTLVNLAEKLEVDVKEFL